MEEYKYVYENPINQGYKQFKLTKKQHNYLFPNRKKVWKNKFEYYYNDNNIILHLFASKRVIIANTIMFPTIVLINGLGEIKEIIKTFKGLYQQKKYGSFSGDSIWSNSELYDKIIKIINREEK